MAFSHLPNELLINIVEYLDQQQDIYSVSLVNQRCYYLFNDHLYRYNVQFRKCSALLWAAKHDNHQTMRRMLHMGANVNHVFSENSSRLLHAIPARASNTNTGFGALHVAAAKGNIASVKLLLEVGADPQAAGPSSCTPLYIALAYRQEKVARTISRRIDSFPFCLVNQQKQLTPLHVASRRALPASVRYCLDRGAIVDARDESGKTPLHHALRPVYLSEEVAEHSPSLDSVFETVELLLMAGADPDLEVSREHTWSWPSTPRDLGKRHTCERVRALFVSRPKPGIAQVGRTWMYEVEEEDGYGCRRSQSISRFFKSRTQSTVNFYPKPDPSNIHTFPALVSTNPSLSSVTEEHLSSGTWSIPKTSQLIEGLSTIPQQDEGSDAEEPEEEPFPALAETEMINLYNEASVDLWANLGEGTKSNVSQSLSDSDNKSTATSKRAKKGKNLWHPLKL